MLPRAIVKFMLTLNLVLVSRVKPQAKALMEVTFVV